MTCHVAGLKVGLGAQRVVSAPGEIEGVTEAVRGCLDHRCRQRPHGGVGPGDQSVDGLAGFGLALVGENLLGLIENPQHASACGQFSQRLGVHAEAVVVHHQHLMALLVAHPALGRGAFDNGGVQLGGVGKEPGEVDLQRTQRGGDDEVNKVAVDHLLSASTGEQALARPGSPVGEHQPVCRTAGFGSFQGAVEPEGLVGVQMPPAGALEALYVEWLLPSGHCVEDGSRAGTEHQRPTVVGQQRGEAAQCGDVVENQEPAKPGFVPAIEQLRLVSNLEYQLAVELGMHLGHDDSLHRHLFDQARQSLAEVGYGVH